jgi:hypothetical protein
MLRSRVTATGSLADRCGRSRAISAGSGGAEPLRDGRSGAAAALWWGVAGPGMTFPFIDGRGGVFGDTRRVCAGQAGSRWADGVSWTLADAQHRGG